MTKNTDTARQSGKIRASRWGAFLLAGIIASVVSAPVLALECPADRIDEVVTVSQVVDGDTLLLEDGRLVRFIGINTPELGRDGKPAEPMAEQARIALDALLGGSLQKEPSQQPPLQKNVLQKPRPSVGLRFGAERKDRYGRTLAHVYLVDGRSVGAELLSAGLAAQIVIPPNVRNLKCYRAAETVAREAQKGVWNNQYRPIPVDELPRDSRGFQVITGRVMQVGESKNSFWLNFPRLPGEGRKEGFAVRISRNDMAYFKNLHPRSLKNKTIVVRGWVYSYQKQLVIRVRHPALLEIVKEDWK